MNTPYGKQLPLRRKTFPLTLLHPEQQKLYGVFATLSAIGFRVYLFGKGFIRQGNIQQVINIVPLCENDEKILRCSQLHYMIESKSADRLMAE